MALRSARRRVWATTVDAQAAEVAMEATARPRRSSGARHVWAWTLGEVGSRRTSPPRVVMGGIQQGGGECGMRWPWRADGNWTALNLHMVSTRTRGGSSQRWALLPEGEGDSLEEGGHDEVAGGDHGSGLGPLRDGP